MILGFIGRGRVKRGEANNGGVAIAGIVLGVLAIIVSLVVIAVWVVGLRRGRRHRLRRLPVQGRSDQQAVQQCADQFRDRVETEFCDHGHADALAAGGVAAA